DFTPIPTVDRHPPALTGLHFFGVVQYIGVERTEDWTEFYAELFGFTPLPDEKRFGVLPKGRVLKSPRSGSSEFFLQLIEPEPGVDAAVRAVRASGLRVTGFQVLRDYEGLSGHLHDYKIDVAKSMLELSAAVGAKLLLVCSSTSAHASADADAIARDLRRLAM